MILTWCISWRLLKNGPFSLIHSKFKYLVIVIVVGSALDINEVRKRKREEDDIVFNDSNIEGEYDALSPNGPNSGYIDEKPKLTEVV